MRTLLVLQRWILRLVANWSIFRPFFIMHGLCLASTSSVVSGTY